MAKFLKKLTGIDTAGKEENIRKLHEPEEQNIEIAEQEQNLSEPEPFSREKAKMDLEKRIAEKLSRMSGRDLEALFNLHQKQLIEKKKEARSSVRRSLTVIEGQLSFSDIKPVPSFEIDLKPPAQVELVSSFESGLDAPVQVETAASFEPEIDTSAQIETMPYFEAELETSGEIDAIASFEAELETSGEIDAIASFEAELESPDEVDTAASFEAELEAPDQIETAASFEAELGASDEIDTTAAFEAELEASDEIGTVSSLDVETAAPTELNVPESKPETPVIQISDEELESRVDDFYRGFSEAEEEEIPTFKENSVIFFNKLSSGEILESGSQNIKIAFGKVKLWLSSKGINAKEKIYRVSSKTSGGFKKLVRKLPPLSVIVPKKLRAGERGNKKTKYFLLNCKKRIKSGQRKISSFMANFINRLDINNDKLISQTLKILKAVNRAIEAAREWADFHKKKLIACLVVIISCAITAVSIFNYFTAYLYAYNGVALGMVKNQEDVLRVLDIVNEQLTREFGAEIEIDSEHDITFERVISRNINNEIDSMQEVFYRLTHMQDMNAGAYAFYIDGRRIAILDSEQSVQNILEEFRNDFLHQNGNAITEYESITFAEDYDIRPIDTQLGRIGNAHDILDRIREGTMAEKVHVVQRGETFSHIARMYGMTQAELMLTNPDVTPARLSIDQEIILQHAVPLLTVQTVEVSTHPDILPYETIFEDNPNTFRGEQNVRVRGVPGERQVTARITRNNGVEVAREELNEVILVPASPAVVVRGTREPPPLQGTGTLIRPLTSRYRITSTFGMRRGRMHNGVDMAAPTGTRIGAADGGTVTFAGYRRSYGYLVIIDHGGGVHTWYAHASRLFVRRGDKVHQGQHIANVGSTGRSTGPHLHFEVHVHGRIENPMNHVRL